MTSVTIRCLRLWLVRHGGWSWGPDPKGLADRAVKVLPELIARRLEAMGSEGVDVEITAPLRVRVPIRLSELRDVVLEDLASPGAAGSPAAISDRLEAALGPTISRALEELEARREAEPASPGPAPETRRAPGADGALSAPTAAAGASPVRWVPRFLLALRERGELGRVLKAMSLEALEAWHLALSSSHGRPRLPEVEGPLTVEVEKYLDAMGPGLRSVPEDPIERLRARIAVLVEASGRFGVPAEDPHLLAAIDRRLPAETGAPPRAPPEHRDGGPPREPPAPRMQPRPEPLARSTPEEHPARHPRGRVSVSVTPRLAWLEEAEVHVPCALPFLVLGVLSRAGFLEAMAATLEAARLSGDAPLFAAALAYKVLRPPERGWRRDGNVRRAAAAFAGLSGEVPEPLIVEFSDRVSGFLSPLDVVLRQSLLRGHDPLRPLLLCCAGSDQALSFLLFEVEGFCPVSWSCDLDSLASVMSDCQGALVLVPGNRSAPGLFAALEGASVRFLTDAPPLRADRWRSLWQPRRGRLWTNDRDSPEPRLIAAGHLLEDAGERFDAIWRALVVERPGIALAVEKSLERTVTLAAGAAMGTIAWELWRDRETADPLLALERFADLDARVRFASRAIHVRLPLGKRHGDLREHGLLEDIGDVPWLGDRTVKFSGG